MSLFKSLKVRASQGSQFIPDLRKALPAGFRGLPVLGQAPCGEGCSACRDLCPTQAMSLAPLRLDLGRCVFCQACEEACPEGKVHFSPEPKMGASRREDLVIGEGALQAAGVKRISQDGKQNAFEQRTTNWRLCTSVNHTFDQIERPSLPF